MKHVVGPRATIEYDKESNEWVGRTSLGEGAFESRSVELTQIVFELMDHGEMEPDTFEWSNRGGVEQVLVVVSADEEEV